MQSHPLRAGGVRSLSFGLMLAMAAPLQAQTFPSNGGWLPLSQKSSVLGDPFDGSPLVPAIDIVGDKSNPAGFVSSDASYLYFRLLVDSDPYKLTPPKKFFPYSWICLLDIDGDPQTYELLTALDGIALPNTVDLEQRTSAPAKPDSIDDPADATLVTYAALTHAQIPPLAAPSSFGGLPNYFADWAVAWADLTAATPTALTKFMPFRMVCGTSTSQNSLSGGDVLDNGSATASFSLAASDTMFCRDYGCEYDAVFKDGFEGP